MSSSAANKWNSSFVGDEACRLCHQLETGTYFETAHHLTSRMPDRNSILGKFNDGANILRTSTPWIYYQMTATNDGYFESAVEELSPFQKVSHSERIDIVFGSGRRGQTYLFWNGNQLLELPVGRAIASDCVDCHMPLEESQVLISHTSGRKLKPWVRNHRIGVYPETQSQ